MRVTVPRPLIVVVAGLFSSYLIVLGVYSLQFNYASSNGPVIVAMAAYALATVAVLVPTKRPRMPVWLAAFAVGIAVVLPLIVSFVLDPQREGGNGYATWYVAAVGALM
ncbi:MAG TPA: hypothetical protein VNS80_06245, partial [Pseudolysinimonas sp.]|nr:hypothetical protein [Pseudolysinimonas sp.]